MAAENFMTSRSFQRPKLQTIKERLQIQNTGMKRLLWYVIAGSRGGLNRARIINLLKDRPYNANQIAELLHLDYKTVTHHLKVLEKNYMISVEGNGYGKLNFLEEVVIKDFEVFLDIWSHIEKKEQK